MKNLSLHNIIYALAVIIFCAVLAPSCSFADGLEDFGIDMEIKKTNSQRIFRKIFPKIKMHRFRQRLCALLQI